MKATLRKLDKGIIATADERPDQIKFSQTNYCKNGNIISKYEGLIIASTFGVGKELQFDFNNKVYVFGLPSDDIIDGEEYDYTETETQVIIKL